MKQKTKKAFTLIELLVVIAIIGLLSTISIIALNSARSKARDSRRVADMHQLLSAVDMYYSQYGDYPPLIDNDSATGYYDASSDHIFMSNLVDAGLLSDDMQDPWNDRSSFYYYWMDTAYPSLTSICGSDAKHLILFNLENDTPLTGFARVCGGQNADTGYRRCICIY